MNSSKKKWTNFFAGVKPLTICLHFAILVLGLNSQTFSAGTCDATSGASMKVVGIRAALTEATISWTEGKHNGDRYFCYGIGTPGKCALVQSRANNTKSQVTKGLTPNSTYSYKFYGTYKSTSQKSVVTGTFKTDTGWACGATVALTQDVTGVILADGKDSLENATVTIFRKSDNSNMGSDLTDGSGQFYLTVVPGDYYLTVTYPPFTPSAQIPIAVVLGKSLRVADINMTGAFLLGGTVTYTGGIAPILAAKVDIYKSVGKVWLTGRTTDEFGHFSVAVPAGSYLVEASLNGKFAPTITQNVTASIELPNMIVPVATTGITRKTFSSKTLHKPQIVNGVDARGVSVGSKAGHGSKIFSDKSN